MSTISSRRSHRDTLAVSDHDLCLLIEALEFSLFSRPISSLPLSDSDSRSDCDDLGGNSARSSALDSNALRLLKSLFSMDDYASGGVHNLLLARFFLYPHRSLLALHGGFREAKNERNCRLVAEAACLCVARNVQFLKNNASWPSSSERSLSYVSSTFRYSVLVEDLHNYALEILHSPSGLNGSKILLSLVACSQYEKFYSIKLKDIFGKVSRADSASKFQLLSAIAKYSISHDGYASESILSFVHENPAMFVPRTMGDLAFFRSSIQFFRSLRELVCASGPPVFSLDENAILLNILNSYLKFQNAHTFSVDDLCHVDALLSSFLSLAGQPASSSGLGKPIQALVFSCTDLVWKFGFYPDLCNTLLRSLTVLFKSCSFGGNPRSRRLVQMFSLSSLEFIAGNVDASFLLAPFRDFVFSFLSNGGPSELDILFVLDVLDCISGFSSVEYLKKARFGAKLLEAFSALSSFLSSSSSTDPTFYRKKIHRYVSFVVGSLEGLGSNYLGKAYLLRSLGFLLSFPTEILHRSLSTITAFVASHLLPYLEDGVVLKCRWNAILLASALFKNTELAGLLFQRASFGPILSQLESNALAGSNYKIKLYSLNALDSYLSWTQTQASSGAGYAFSRERYKDLATRCGHETPASDELKHHLAKLIGSLESFLQKLDSGVFIK